MLRLQWCDGIAVTGPVHPCFCLTHLIFISVSFMSYSWLKWTILLRSRNNVRLVLFKGEAELHPVMQRKKCHGRFSNRSDRYVLLWERIGKLWHHKVRGVAKSATEFSSHLLPSRGVAGLGCSVKTRLNRAALPSRRQHSLKAVEPFLNPSQTPFISGALT